MGIKTSSVAFDYERDETIPFDALPTILREWVAAKTLKNNGAVVFHFKRTIHGHVYVYAYDKDNIGHDSVVWDSDAFKYNPTAYRFMKGLAENPRVIFLVNTVWCNVAGDKRVLCVRSVRSTDAEPEILYLPLYVAEITGYAYSRKSDREGIIYGGFGLDTHYFLMARLFEDLGVEFSSSRYRSI